MTLQAYSFDEIFHGAPLMAILRGMGVARSLTLAETAWDLGLDAIEIPLQADEDELALRKIAERASDRGKIVGAGTILTVEQIERARDAGARYLVSPGLDEELVHAAAAHGLPLLPGVATPTEVQSAVHLGLTWMKAFPARCLGAEWFTHIRGPFPDVRFVATGGLDASNVRTFLDAGVKVVAVGSALEDQAQLTQLSNLLASLSPENRHS